MLRALQILSPFKVMKPLWLFMGMALTAQARQNCYKQPIKRLAVIKTFSLMVTMSMALLKPFHSLSKSWPRRRIMKAGLPLEIVIEAYPL